MRNARPIIAFCWLVLALNPAARAGEVLDRIVATVNSIVVLQSEWEEEARYECFLNQKPLDSLTHSEQAEILDRLIDRRIIEQQMLNTSTVAPVDIARPLQELRRQIAARSKSPDPEGWEHALQQYGLTQAVVERLLAQQIAIAHFIDARFRVGIRIDETEIERYFNEQLVPALRKQGTPEPPLEKAAPQIREILTQQTINRRMTAWLDGLRTQSKIEVR